MTLRVTLDERTWNDADEARRAEWEIAMRQLGDSSDVTHVPEATELHVVHTEQGFVLELRDADGHPVQSAHVVRDALAPHVQEYVDVVRQLERAYDMGGQARIEALDMGKKAAHDAAARTLHGLCGHFGLDHASCRRLFTLLFSLRVDTTRLTGVRGHRPVR